MGMEQEHGKPTPMQEAGIISKMIAKTIKEGTKSEVQFEMSLTTGTFLSRLPKKALEILRSTGQTLGLKVKGTADDPRVECDLFPPEDEIEQSYDFLRAILQSATSGQEGRLIEGLQIPQTLIDTYPKYKFEETIKVLTSGRSTLQPEDLVNIHALASSFYERYGKSHGLEPPPGYIF